MKKRISNKILWEELKKHKKSFLKQKQFPALTNPYYKRIQPIMFAGNLMFIRSKFLFLGLIKSIEDKNLFVTYSLLKSYWENVATFGYYYLTISTLLKDDKEEEAFVISRKMGLGGRGFLTKKMVEAKGQTLEDYKIPRISKMMELVDEDWRKTLGDDSSLFKEEYDKNIAEGGHTTYSGLVFAWKWLPGRKSVLPDVGKAWDTKEKSPILNLISLSSIVFFYYWRKFQELDKI